MNSFAESFRVLGEAARKSAYAFDLICEMLIQLRIDMYPHKRSLYLTMHGSPRVRKKNQKRYHRYLVKQSRNT